MDRAGRPLTGNALLGQLRPDEEGDRWKEAYNAATPADGAKFEAEIARGLAYYDSFDGQCGNQWLADAKAPPARRYHRLAAALADDRLWVNSATGICTQMFAVELAALSDERAPRVRLRRPHADLRRVQHLSILPGERHRHGRGRWPDAGRISALQHRLPLPGGAGGAAVMRRLVLILAALGFSGPAAAHSGTGLPGGFGPGFLHPFGGLDHLLAMVAVGLWGAFLGAPLLLALPVLFPAMMVVGAIAGMLGLPLPPVELGIACSVLVLGGCIAGGVKAPAWLALPLVAVFALFHGYAHGRELPSAADPAGYSAGFVLATGLLHLAGVAIGHLNRRPGGARATRGLGGGIALLGVGFLIRVVLP
ncbi:HupE/UreJ family protein [Nitrospirillum sp. BR 11163]|uniref:HupE/UreJ family protein n=1 Tax=Nitrospirillum sp. BR 11163 TaxID=3104323 RepID=UPI002B003211|nr:HupE/UreJ family protein [Nitrospirillum sp. BR 11163]MEA1675162.1 HupE/UreJ family protein [Nitrospirillum sp. BR 11163]